MSSQEAIWRSFEFDLNEISPPVINLQHHLPDQHFVTYWATEDLQTFSDGIIHPKQCSPSIFFLRVVKVRMQENIFTKSSLNIMNGTREVNIGQKGRKGML